MRCRIMGGLHTGLDVSSGYSAAIGEEGIEICVAAAEGFGVVGGTEHGHGEGGGHCCGGG